MDERNSTISLEKARNGSTVAIINGVYLHSVYDPEKEADAFVETYEKQLQLKNHILILGLALGYHIEKVTKYLRTHHGEYKITVLETNEELIKISKEKQQFDEQRVSIIHLSDYKKLYAKKEFVNFLMQKPCLLKHEASFGLSKEKYTGFLTYKSSKETTSYTDLLSETTKDLISLRSEFILKEMGNQIKASGHIEGRSEFLAMALNEVIKLDQEEI